MSGSPATSRIVALEEHFASSEQISRIPDTAVTERGWPAPGPAFDAAMHTDEIYDLGDRRLHSMDNAGITTQILSAAGPGAELLDSSQGPSYARDYNDLLADATRTNAARFAGFAHLPMSAPQAAADELERCVTELGFVGAMVNGTTDGLFLDDPRFEPILQRAETLGVPIYIHPALPPRAVMDAYYSHLPDVPGFQLATAGWGWHSETAIHIIRLVLSGTLERHHGLKLVIGHMGEMLPMMLERLDDWLTAPTRSYLSRTVSETLLEQLWITTSGFFSLQPFLAALTSFGTDHIMFSVDWPFSDNQRAIEFLNQLPVSNSDRQRIAHGNADALLKLN